MNENVMACRELFAQGVRPKSIKCNQSLPRNCDCVTMRVHSKLIVSDEPLHNADVSVLAGPTELCISALRCSPAGVMMLGKYGMKIN